MRVLPIMPNRSKTRRRPRYVRTMFGWMDGSAPGFQLCTSRERERESETTGSFVVVGVARLFCARFKREKWIDWKALLSFSVIYWRKLITCHSRMRTRHAFIASVIYRPFRCCTMMMHRCKYHRVRCQRYDIRFLGVCLLVTGHLIFVLFCKNFSAENWFKVACFY